MASSSSPAQGGATSAAAGEPGYTSPLDIGESSDAHAKLESGELHLETTCCGVEYHPRSLRSVAIICVALTLAACFVLFGSAFWVLDETSGIVASSCCLPVSCQESSIISTLTPIAASPNTESAAGRTTADNGLCVVALQEARAMNCVAEIAVADFYSRNTDSSANCTIAGTKESGAGPTQCRGRASFPTDFARASCALSIVAAVFAVLFVVVVGTDGYFVLFGHRSSKVAVTFLLFALVLLCCGAGIALAVRPMNVALQRSSRPVEVVDGVTGRAEPNLLFLRQEESGTFSPLYYAEGCGSLTRTKAQIVGFLKFGSSGSNNGDALVSSFYLMMVAQGLVFLFVTLCLALSWQAGNLIHVLLWTEGGGAAGDADDEQTRALVRATQEQLQTEQDLALAQRIAMDRLRQEKQRSIERERSRRERHLLLYGVLPEVSTAAERSAYLHDFARREQQGGADDDHLPMADFPHDRSHSQATTTTMATTSVAPSATRHRQPQPEHLPRFNTSVRNADHVHPHATENDVLVRMRIAAAKAVGERGSHSPPMWQRGGPPIEVDATGRLMI
jgi:hypothetical protein